MDIRKLGLWVCPAAFVAMLVAYALDRPVLVLIEAALMITGAILALHPKRQRSMSMHINGPINPPSVADIERMAKNRGLR